MPSLKLSLADLTPFADLGTSVEEAEDYFRVVRNGDKFHINVVDERYVLVKPDGSSSSYNNAGLLLAQPAFANLPLLARNQSILLMGQRIKGRPIPISTKLKPVFGSAAAFSENLDPWVALDRWLREQQTTHEVGSTSLVLIDGPAGVGKTTIVREAALLRAENYDGSEPLILQIASRGRVLQNISDLIAYALQDVRSNLTVAQLTPLMRHGCITLAIDGFDELSDPNGFQTAWTGLNELLAGARGLATFLLAGRETFVSTDTMRRQLRAIKSDLGDRLSTLSLGDPDPSRAREWLLEKDGWSHELLDRQFVSPLFSLESYALRPFFLDVIAREPQALTSETPPASDLLSYLVEVMTLREAGKFVEELDPPDGGEAESIYATYVFRFLEEVARDLAENQSEAISEDALDLIATVAADGVLPDDQVSAVVQRARSVVFLSNDLQAGHVRFAHEQLLQHFLAREALRSVGEGEIPRYIRRNLFGREALDVFAHVSRDRTEQTEQFLEAVREGLKRPARDRTHTNLAVLGVAAMCAVSSEEQELIVPDIGIGELHFPFAAPPGIYFSGTTISILYAAGADVREVVFDNGASIVTLEIDRRSLWAESLPLPQILVRPEGTTADYREIESILNPVDSGRGSEANIPWPDETAELLGRIDRYRSFWLRTDEDKGQGNDRTVFKIISHPDWPIVFDALKELDFVTVKTLGASGARSEFVHFRQDIRLLESRELYEELQP